MKERSKESKERKAVVVVEEKKEKETTTTSRAGVPPRATREVKHIESHGKLSNRMHAHRFP